MPAPATLPPLADQADRLIELGVHELAGLSSSALRRAATIDANDALLVIHPDRAPASALTPLLRHRGKTGFVVIDMPDVDQFAPIDEVAVPTSLVYIVSHVDRGDDMADWSPNEALPAITAAGRTPLILTEGICQGTVGTAQWRS